MSDNFDRWRDSDAFTVVQAALLISNNPPAEHQDYVLSNQEINRPEGFTDAFEVLKMAVRLKKLMQK